MNYHGVVVAPDSVEPVYDGGIFLLTVRWFEDESRNKNRLLPSSRSVGLSRSYALKTGENEKVSKTCRASVVNTSGLIGRHNP